MIGNYRHQCSCVRYVSHDGKTLIIWLSLGLVLLLIIFIGIVVLHIVCRRRRNSPKLPEGNAGAAVINLEDKRKSYSRRLPDEYRETGIDSSQDSSYSRQLPDNYIGPTSSTGADYT